MTRKRSFFEKLTGTAASDEEHYDTSPVRNIHLQLEPDAIKEEEGIGELSVDVFEDTNDIIVQTMIAGVYPEDIDLSITRDSITIKGSRREEREDTTDTYHYKELYWGSFTRTLALPNEIEPEEAEATEKHGLLTIRLPKINKDKERRLKVRST
ncbi:MAG: Hsp20/alpha crystallin family protein [bacterium]|nr:Hsp20/alpha crystallin family protein [bacterium]